MRKALTVVVTSIALVVGMTAIPNGASAATLNVLSFTQCENGGPPSTDTGCSGGWINGTLNGTHSHYTEDEVVPQRIVLSSSDNTTDGTISIQYDLTKSSGPNTEHAYDSLATWNITQFTAPACLGVTPATVCSGTPSTMPMASDTLPVPPPNNASDLTNLHELPAASRLWTLYGGTITSVAPITHSGAQATATITVRANTAGATMVLLFGGHLAVGGVASGPQPDRGWGLNLGASSINGGPYSITVNGTTTNSIQAGSLVAGVPNFTITKSANPTATTAGGSVTYTITVTNTGSGPGSVTFVDNYDDRLSPTTPVSNPSGGTCTAGNNAGDLFWTCGTIQLASLGGTQTFTYTATMPTSFSSGAGTDNCAATAYPVVNTATLATGGTPGTATVCVTATPTFTINKVADPLTANPGDTVTYTITVSNTGSAIGSTTFSDDYDNRLTPTVPAGCTAAGGVLSCTTDPIGPGLNQVFTYTAVMPQDFSGSAGTGCSTGQFALVNTASLPRTGAGSSSSQTVCVNAVPAFTIQKTVTTAGPYTPGETITYQIKVTNGGHADAATSFTDDYDDRLTPSTVTSTGTGSCTATTIPVNNKVLQCTTGTIVGQGGSETFTYTAQLPSLFSGNTGADCAPGQYEIKNTATLLNNTADSATVCVAAAPDFTIQKIANPLVTTAGMPVTYTITVTNNGKAAGSTTVIDDYDDRLNVTAPAGCTLITNGSNKELSCATGTIAGGGATQQFQYTVNMPGTFDGGNGTGGCATGSYPVSNVATIVDNGRHDGQTVCVSAAPSFTIDKTATPSSAQPGDPVSYLITVTNHGTASGSTTFTDDYDDRLAPSLPLPSPATGPGCTADTQPGGNLVFDCTTGSILAGSSQTFSYSANMPLTFTDPGTGCPAGQYAVTNTASLPGGSSKPATVCVTAAPAFTLTKTPDSTNVNPGAPVTYTIVVTNGGTASGSTTFTDDFDDRITPGTVTVTGGATTGSCHVAIVGLNNHVLQCTTGTILAGTAQTFTYTANMPATFNALSPVLPCLPGQFSVSNTATLTGAHSDTSPHTAVVCVNAAPTFTVKKVADVSSIDQGGTVHYTITVTNGGAAHGSTTFTDDYDDRLTPSAVTASGSGSCTPATVLGNDVLQCSTGDIDAGASETFMYSAQMPTQFTGDPGGQGCTTNPEQFPIHNVVTLFNLNSDNATVCVNAAPLFTIDKSFEPSSVSADGTVTYHVKMTNNGHAAGSTGFVDDYDDQLTPSAVTSTGTGGCVATTQGTNKVLDCTTGTINGGGGSETFTYTAKMPPTFSGPSGQGGCDPGTFPIHNTATLDNGTSSAKTVCVAAAPTFTIDKSATPANVSTGDPVTYVVTVRNTGTASGSTTFTDDYDDRLSPTLPLEDPAGGGCSLDVVAGNKVLDCTTGTILAGGSQTFTYSANMPGSFTGKSGGGGCDTGSYPVSNTATLTSVSVGSKPATVCVNAAPAFRLDKSVDPTTSQPGLDVTYTVTITNTGTAPGSTSFTDDYDDRLSPQVPAGCSLGTIGTNKVLNCTTDSIDPGKQQLFVYKATLPSTFQGDPGTGCGPNQYAVSNSATLVDVPGSTKGATVCVDAAPAFTITKSVLTTGPFTANEPVTYQITVSNGGTASGTTTFTDDYDDRLSPGPVTISGSGGNCALGTVPVNNKVLNCSTGTILAGDSQTFTYSAAMPSAFTGDPGGDGCTATNPQQYPVENTATLANGNHDGAIVCVDAAPDFTVTKVADPTTIDAGGQVTYTITVTNGGTAAGTTTFTDDFDDRLSPGTVTISGSGGACSVITPGGNAELSCSTGTILSGGTQTFSYKALMPATFAGPAGGVGCTTHPQQYPVTNSVLLANGRNTAATVCVNAAPIAKIVKSVVKSTDTSGDELLTYTLAYTNTGSATATTTLITDSVPAQTTYVSCTGGCTTAVSPIDNTTVTGVVWSLGSTSALTGSGSVTFTVLVVATATCSINNSAFLTYDDNDPVESNTVTVTIDAVANPSGAHASGSAIGAQVKASGIVGIGLGPIGTVSTSRSGLGPVSVAQKQFLGIDVPANGGILRVPVISETSSSGVEATPPFAANTTSAAVSHVCLLPIANVCTVQADTVQAVASTLATGQWATYSTGGSTIQNLKILGATPVVNLNNTTTINLNPLVFGKGSHVSLMERTGTAGLVGSTYKADLTVTAIHLVITGLLNIQALDLIVSQATSHADFPQTLQCGNTPQQSVSGHAFVAQLLNDYPIADTTVGYVAIPPSGGNEEQALASVNLPANDSILGASAADSHSYSNFSPTQSFSQSTAEIGGNVGPVACVVRISPTNCLITAQAIHSKSTSSATAAGATSTDAGTSLVNVSVLGLPVKATVPPNTAVIIPGFGYVVLNEQFCDGGGLTFTHRCTGAHHSGLTVRAVDLVFTFLGSGLGVVPATEVIVGEAHSDATFGNAVS